MNDPSLIATEPSPPPSSLGSRLLNMFVCPGEVFDEVVAGSDRPANWLVPILLVCLTNLFLLWAIATQEHTSVAVQALARSAAIPVSQSDTLYARWQTTSALAIGVAAFAGTLWCAFVLWFTGRWCLKTSFRFRQSLAVTGLGSMILALGALVTALLVLATGDRAARPALSLLAPGLPLESPLRLAMETLNFFHLWIAAVLTLGLSKLSSVSAKEAGFWVFSYWVAARLGLILLA